MRIGVSPGLHLTGCVDIEFRTTQDICVRADGMHMNC